MRGFRPASAVPGTCLVLLLAALPTLAADLPLVDPGPLLGTGGNQSPALTQPAGKVLPPDQAFVLTVLPEANHDIVLHWDIHTGHYLYRDSLQVSTADGTVLTPELPPTVGTTDEFFGTVEVYFERLQLRVPASQSGAAPGKTTELLLVYQGCAKDLYCYPPQQRAVSLQFPD